MWLFLILILSGCGKPTLLQLPSAPTPNSSVAPDTGPITFTWETPHSSNELMGMMDWVSYTDKVIYGTTSGYGGNQIKAAFMEVNRNGGGGLNKKYPASSGISYEYETANRVLRAVLTFLRHDKRGESISSTRVNSSWVSEYQQLKGYSPSEIDGVLGPETTLDLILDYQDYLRSKGFIAAIKDDGLFNYYRNEKRIEKTSYYMSDFDTGGNSDVLLFYPFVKKLYDFQEILNKKLSLSMNWSGNFNSGYRSPEHNSSIGGASQSAHLYGAATDIGTNALWAIGNYWQQKNIWLSPTVVPYNSYPKGLISAAMAAKDFQFTGIEVGFNGSQYWLHVDYAAVGRDAGQVLIESMNGLITTGDDTGYWYYANNGYLDVLKINNVTGGYPDASNLYY